MPDYSLLPSPLTQKTQASDPYPTYAPNRTVLGDFYQTIFAAEALTKANTITQRIETAPGVFTEQPMLDTLYSTTSGAIGPNKPIMTLYHGPENAPVVFSGFPLWYFQREQAIGIADFVLGTFWGMPRRPVQR